MSIQSNKPIIPLLYVGVFENICQESIGGFEEFKKSLNEEFVEYVKSFDVKAGQAISIDGDELRSTKIPDDVEAMFELFNKF